LSHHETLLLQNSADENHQVKQFTELPVNQQKATIKSVQTQLQKFWNLEHIGIEQFKDDVYSFEEQMALDAMKKVSHYSETEKRWYTSLLWKMESSKLGCNYKRCSSVLSSVERGAVKRDTVPMVNDFFKELVDNDFAELVPTADEKDKVAGLLHYIPCHAVYRFDRESTKCRMVMNCSSKTETGFSLNDLLYTGPLLLPDYVKILIQFRLHCYAFTTDISKMFLQIRLSSVKEMDFLRFLWRDACANIVPNEYRMKVLVFGAVSSPFQAIWCVKEHAVRNGAKLPLAQLLIAENLYMDDVASSCASLDEALQSVKEIDSLFQSASMVTHKWASNNPLSLEGFSSDRKATPGKIKVFGQSWNTIDDTLLFKFCELEAAEAGGCDTKRTFLQRSASIFDPIGLLAPFTLSIKLLFQQLWAQKIEWDDALPQELQESWNHFKHQIPQLSEIVIPRSLTKEKVVKHSYLVTFCDSSFKAYAACTYLLVKYTDESTSSSLVLAKTRVAPVKLLDKVQNEDKMTIVRLELLGMLIGARLNKYVCDTIEKRISLTNVFLFSDSMINLCRLRKGFNNYGCWVAARLREILELSSISSWNHVPTDQNPADLGSRGISKISNLMNETLWWNGPQFLQTVNPEDWCTISPIKGKDSWVDTELQKEIKQIFVIGEIHYPDVCTKFSSWEKTVRVLAYVRRFINRSLKYQSRVVGAKEYRNSENSIFVLIQRQHFLKDITHLQEKVEPPKDSKIKNLSAFMSSDLLRHKSRLESSKLLAYDVKYPIILPNHDLLIEKYILHLHKLHLHAGLNTMLSIIRKRFLLLKGRREVKRILNLCRTRKCVKPKLLQQIMAPLPHQRVDDPIAFHNIAVDLFGPLYVKSFVEEEEQLQKVYGCIFTCLTSRAIHLEVMLGMSTEEFLNAFRMMCARKGTPKVIFSDRGKYFQKADKELQKLYKAVNWDRVVKQSTPRDIEWIFNAPSAPWQTGIVERMVQSTKKPLRTIIGSAKLTYRQLQVLLADVEAMINNRPLAVINEESFIPITPAELVFGRRLDDLPIQTKISDNMSFAEMWKKRKNLTLAFWKKWRNDYLMTLSVRQKWNRPLETDLMGKIVLINDDNAMKNEWKLGRIIECHKGRQDDYVRAVDLKTETGVIRRPLQRLALLG